jgi:hypothetical protein
VTRNRRSVPDKIAHATSTGAKRFEDTGIEIIAHGRIAADAGRSKTKNALRVTIAPRLLS